MGKIISFANQKGGVGKTTSCVNIAASLGVLGFKVLLIDLDPQGNATSGVGISKKVLKATTKELLTGELPVDQIIQETPYKNLHVIPTNTALAGAEFELFDIDEPEFRIKKGLESVKDNYDYILIDCPPLARYAYHQRVYRKRRRNRSDAVRILRARGSVSAYGYHQPYQENV